MGRRIFKQRFGLYGVIQIMGKRSRSIGRKEKADEYYSLDRLLECNATYNIAFGKRSRGKTFACLKYCLERFVKYGEQFAYVRREDTDFKQKRAAVLFDNLNAAGVIYELTHGEWSEVYYYSGRFYLSKVDEEHQTRTNSPDPIGFTFSLTTSSHDKSAAFPDVWNIFFDEFIPEVGHTYLYQEFAVFHGLLSTIIRKKIGVKIFMAANALDPYCIYFREFGLKHVKDMKPGQLDTYTFDNERLTIAIEYTDSSPTDSESEYYYAFDNPRLKMITDGTWSMDLYPHLTPEMKYKPKDVKLTYYIEYDNECVKCEIVKMNRDYFTSIHRKTTPIKDEKALIFSTEQQLGRTRRVLINSPIDQVGKAIWQQFFEKKVYYSENEVGNLVDAYIQWCYENRR